MKKIFFLPALFLLLFSFSGCEKDESLDPRPDMVAGQYVRLDITNKVIAIEHIDSAMFGGTLTAPGGNVQRYELSIRRTSPDGVVTGNYVKLLTVQSFPTQLEITPQMIADALSIPVTDLKAGDIYRFSGASFSANGTKMDYSNLSATVKAQTGLKQAFRFVTGSLTDLSIAGLTDTETGIITYDNYQQ
jgi:hypothetical protein